MKLLLTIFLFAATAYAQNALVPAPLILSSTFESISVKAPFSGDANGNATPSVQYRQSGTSAWKDAYTPLIDRRATIGGVANPYANQARVSIVGLAANTSYEVSVLWNDPDGSARFTTHVFTLSSNPPTGGTTTTVTNGATLTAALGIVSPGQTIHLKAGNYPTFPVSRSGNGSAYITIEGEPGVIIAGNASRNVYVNANFVVLKNLTLGPSDSSGIVVAANKHHVFVQDNVVQDISAKCALDPSKHYSDAGISVSGGANNVFVLRNTIISTSLSNPACMLSPIYQSPAAGIQWGNNVSTLVVADNTVKGAFRDSITGDSNFLTENADIIRNTVFGDYRDDGVESKGANVNVRMGWNTILTTGPGGFTCIAGNSNNAALLYGPFYIYRNACTVTNTFGLAGTVLKLGGAPTYVFQNSMDASGAAVRWDGVVSSSGNGRADLTYLNNSLKLAGNAIALWLTGSTLDYNAYVSTNPTINIVRKWNGTTDYKTLAQFQSATKQDLHSAMGTVTLDKGVRIANFNDTFKGAAPDIGAREVQ